MEPKFANLRTVEDISILKGTAFEEYLGSIFGDLGYAVDLTPASGDFGADLILSKDGKRIAVQAKQYAKPAGFDAVKEVHFARTYYETSQAWVIATHGFTPQATKAAETTGIRLIDGKELLALSLRAQSGHTKYHTASQTPIDGLLFNASVLIVNKGSALPGLLQSELNISLEKATGLLGQMESLGIIIRTPDSSKAVIPKREFTALVDELYDPSTAKPRFAGDGYDFEVFRSSDPDCITVVENPTTYPSLYWFERNPEPQHPVDKWVCVGIDPVDKLGNSLDIAQRLERVSSLKLYNVLYPINATRTITLTPGTCRVEKPEACEDFTAIAMALHSARIGDSAIERPGYAARRRTEIARAKELEKANQIRQQTLREKEERRDLISILVLAAIPSVILMLLMSSCMR